MPFTTNYTHFFIAFSTIVNNSLSSNYDSFPRKNIHGYNKILRILKQSIMILMDTCMTSQWADGQYMGFYKKETGRSCHKSNETKQTITLAPISLHFSIQVSACVCVSTHLLHTQTYSTLHDTHTHTHTDMHTCYTHELPPMHYTINKGLFLLKVCNLHSIVSKNLLNYIVSIM